MLITAMRSKLGVMPWWCVSLDPRHQLALRGEEVKKLILSFLPLLV